MRFPSRHVYLLLSLAILFGYRPTALAATNETPVPSPATAAAPAKAATTTPRGPDLADLKSTRPPVAEFKPPFPERTDLFEAPKRDQSTVRRDDEHGQSVELKGFVNVDGPCVILVIDGVMSSVPEGGEKNGVKVISVQPPTAVLQRGRNRWPVTLE
jgi:hypothetical protein